jgi:hypothetical protein
MHPLYCALNINFDIWTKIFQEIPYDYDPLKIICVLKMINKEFYKSINNFLSITAKKLQPMINRYPISEARIQNHYFIKWLQAVDDCIDFNIYHNPARSIPVSKIVFGKNSEKSFNKLRHYILFFSKNLKINHKTVAWIFACGTYHSYYTSLEQGQ